MNSVPWTREHVATVRRAPLSKQRGGYNCDDVDRYLQHVVALMRAGGEVPSAPMSGLRRSPLKQGYSPAAVEALFGHIADWQTELAAPKRAPAEAMAAAVPQRPYWTPQQLDWVRESNFRPARGKRGYAEDEVDSFLDRVLIAMTGADGYDPAGAHRDGQGGGVARHRLGALLPAPRRSRGLRGARGRQVPGRPQAPAPPPALSGTRVE